MSRTPHPDGPAAHSPPLLRDLLRDVSRSFYLTLRILPKPVRDQIGLAYLLARATDTIADTEAIPVEERLSALRILRGHILGEAAGPLALPALRAQQGSPSERALLERVDEALRLLFQFEPADRALIQNVLATISEGQALDLHRFGRASQSKIVALSSDAELHDYTYRVAGCVGEFWTRICVAHLRPAPPINLDSLVERGIRFGKGLQLVNILRDLPVDLRQGRCYLPWPALHIMGLTPSDLLNPANEAPFRPLYNEWLKTAEDHLKVAWQYVLNLPRNWFRLRLACSWPVLIGLRTLDRLRYHDALNPDVRVKVSRSEVKGIVRRTVLLYPFRQSWEQLPQDRKT